jgi:Flp pilus assembly pilin Flp
MKALIPNYVKVRDWTEAKLHDEQGATMVEYALLAVLIAAALAGTITALSGGLSGLFGTVVSAFP